MHPGRPNIEPLTSKKILALLKLKTEKLRIASSEADEQMLNVLQTIATEMRFTEGPPKSTFDKCSGVAHSLLTLLDCAVRTPEDTAATKSASQVFKRWMRSDDAVGQLCRAHSAGPWLALGVELSGPELRASTDRHVKASLNAIDHSLRPRPAFGLDG